MTGQTLTTSDFALATGWLTSVGEFEDPDGEERLKKVKQKPREPGKGGNICEIRPWPRPEIGLMEIESCKLDKKVKETLPSRRANEVTIHWTHSR